MKVNANLVSIANMIAVTIFLFFMDSKDIYYKITMCGPYPTFSFLLQPPEVVTDYDLVKALKESNGTRLSPVNQWNALALQCDQFFLSQLGDKAAHLSTIKAAVKRVAATFATRIGLWDRTLCYELTEMLPPGEFKKHVRAIEHGCIWMDMKTKEKVVFHIEPAAGKYYRALSDMMGLQWHTMDYLSLGNGIFLRARAYMKTYYDVGQSTDGKKYFRHDVTSDLGVDGTLYYVLMINEIVIVLINAADVGIVAMIAVRPLLRSKRTSVYSTDSTSTSTNTPVSLKKLSVQLQNRGSKSQVYVRTESVQLKQSEKNSTLSKMLLYTDLTSVSYHKPLLSMLLVVDTLLSWLWVVPNSSVFAWATIAFQVGSAYLSIFRVWIIVLILIDDLWKWTFVFVHEKLAALITEFTYVTSFEIMCATLIGIYIAYDDIMNICVLKHGLVDGQRAMTPTSPTLASFYNSYTQYSWGDRSNDHEALYYIYKHSPRSLSTAYYSAFSRC